MSLSDDEKHKIKYKKFINDCHKIADQHEEYCNTHCFLDYTTGWYPHTKECINYRTLHYESFVYCNSIFCLKLNEVHYLKPSYTREEVKKEVIRELTFYSDDDDY